MKILLIDNYDSFSYNVVQLIGKFTTDIIVRRNDRTNIEEIKTIAPDKIVISPGPGIPEESGISLDIINRLGKSVPILGVCLGHQAIGYCFGAAIVNAPVLMHGKTSAIHHNGKNIYKNVPQNFIAARYHSLIIEKETLPECLDITAESAEGIIMSIKHKELPVCGIQYHPESFLTTEGVNIIKNWIEQ